MSKRAFSCKSGPGGQVTARARDVQVFLDWTQIPILGFLKIPGFWYRTLDNVFFEETLSMINDKERESYYMHQQDCLMRNFAWKKNTGFETVGYIFWWKLEGQARNVLYRKALFSGQTLWWISSNVEGRCSLIVLGQKDNWLWLSIVAIDEPQNSRLMVHLNFLFQHFLNIFYVLKDHHRQNFASYCFKLMNFFDYF